MLCTQDKTKKKFARLICTFHLQRDFSMECRKIAIYVGNHNAEFLICRNQNLAVVIRVAPTHWDQNVSGTHRFWIVGDQHLALAWRFVPMLSA